METWKRVHGYDGKYHASDLGRIKSIGNKKERGGCRIVERFLKQSKVNGYLRVVLSYDGEYKGFGVHQVVAMAFLDHTPNGHSLIVNHINGDRADNRLRNLEIVTSRENITTCYRKNAGTFASKFVGVSWDKRKEKWQSKISIEGKCRHLGYFPTEVHAYIAYSNALENYELNGYIL